MNTLNKQKRSIEYQELTITIPTTEGMRTIPAMIGIGSGLAYNHVSNNSVFGYTVTVLNAGNYKMIQNHEVVLSECVAQLWLENVARLTDWTKDKDTMLRNLYKRYGNIYCIRLQIHDCLAVAIETFNEERTKR